LVADLFDTIHHLKQQVQVVPNKAAPLSVVRAHDLPTQTPTVMAAIAQLEAKLNAYTEATQTQIEASEARMERQLQAIRQQLLLVLGDLDTHVADQVREAIAPLQVEQTTLAQQVETVAQEVAVHHYDLLDVQTQLTHHIDYTEDRLEQQQDGFHKLLVVGVAIALGCLALPIALQWKTTHIPPSTQSAAEILPTPALTSPIGREGNGVE
jgi:hypothetical protein